MALTKTKHVIVASATNAAAATTRGTLDVRTKDGGLVTMKITNGGTGPTVQCEGRILISHEPSVTPAAAVAGNDWKTVYRFGGGVTANAVTEMPYEFGPGVQHIEVEFTGNTGQSVTVEAEATCYAYS